MKNVLFTTEAISALIILILLYANVFELKRKTRKRIIFTRLLIINVVVVVADAVSWLSLGWDEKPAVLWLLIAVTYIVPFFIVGTFSGYLYEHIAEKTELSRRPFNIIGYLAAVVGVVSLVLCITGKLFEIREGKFYPGPMESLYYLFYIVCLIFLSAVIIWNARKLGLHDLIAALSFCLFPLASIVASMTDLGINLAVPFMSADTLIIYIMLQSEGEKKLFVQSNTDELTGLLNRRAYEDDLMQYPDVPPEQDFVYASIDINGLKQVNDTLGHAAGDELIRGAAECLKQTLGNYGRVYRTGGDEFAAMFFAGEEKLDFLMKDLERETGKWNGRLVDSLALSAGFASKREFQKETVAELAKISDKRMYQAKERYYSGRGVDRRRKDAAHAALCSLYTKILKIDLTNDSYSIVSMDIAEQTGEMGFADTISEWFAGFGKSGNVHSDDLNEYLRKTDLEYLKGYFKEGKTSITIYYRRKYNDSFKQVAMEMIPADDYSETNQTLFLYVKNIDV